MLLSLNNLDTVPQPNSILVNALIYQKTSYPCNHVGPHYYNYHDYHHQTLYHQSVKTTITKPWHLSPNSLTKITRKVAGFMPSSQHHGIGWLVKVPTKEDQIYCDQTKTVPQRLPSWGVLFFFYFFIWIQLDQV